MASSSSSWPKYYANQIILNTDSPDADVAVLCGWTKRDLVWDNFITPEAKQRVAAVGQLYSREGISYVIRNLFLNPKIKHIVITGNDLSRSLQTLFAFLKGEDIGGLIHKEIPQEKIREFQAWFGAHHTIERNRNTLSAAILAVPKVATDWIQATVEFPEPEKRESTDFPSEQVGIRIEEKKIAPLWLKVLDRVLKFGREKKSQYAEMQRELIDLVTVISDENPDEPYTPEYFYMTKQDLLAYYPQLMSDTPIAGTEYTYGSRLRSHFSINQIESLIRKLKDENYTRRAVAVAWDPRVDDANKDAPCLDLVQALVQNDKVHMTFYMRSNDMYRAWPQNAFAFLKVQKEVAEGTGLSVGKCVIISASAHIYERDYEAAAEVVKKNKGMLECNQDPRGNFEIRIDNEMLTVNHFTPDGIAIQSFTGKTADDIMHQIYPFLSEIPHALDFGKQLAHAQIALEQKLKFTQDHNLDFTGFTWKDASMRPQLDFTESETSKPSETESKATEKEKA